MAYLLFKIASGETKNFLINRDIITIGRHSSNDIFIDDESVSRFHAEIEKRGTDFYIRDLDSRNGVIINDVPILEYQLQNKDVILLGNTELEFYSKDTPETAEEEISEEVKTPNELELFCEQKSNEKIPKIYETILYLKNIELSVASANSILEKCVKKEEYGEVAAASDITQTTIDNLKELTYVLYDSMKGKSRPTEKCSVNDIVSDVVESIEGKAESVKILISTKFDTKLPEISLNKFNIYNALMMFVNNSFEAMENKEGGELIICTEYNDDDTISIIIQDNGKGIAAEDKLKIFDPFFTTKVSGHSGMGLTIAKKLIERNKGRIEFDSEKDLGTTFAVILPINKK